MLCQVTRRDLSVFKLSCHLPSAHVSATHTHAGGSTLSFSVLNIKRKSCEFQFLYSLVRLKCESNPNLPFQQQTILSLCQCSVDMVRLKANLHSIRFLSVFLRFCFLKKYALFHPHFYKCISALSTLLHIGKKFV